MKRAEFVEILRKVEPALSSKDAVPVQSCFCFDGKSVLAYDDVVAMQAPCEVELAGGLKGKVLLPFLQTSRAKEVELSTADGDGLREVTIKAGRSRLKLPLVDDSDVSFKFPTGKGATEVKPGTEFKAALQRALVSLGSDPGVGWQFGVTLVWGKRPVLYSSDNRGACKITFRDPGFAGDNKPMVLPPQFCRLLVGLASGDDLELLLLHQQWTEARFASGLRLFSRTVTEVDTKSYEELFDGTKGIEPLVIPDGLERCIDRSKIIAGFMMDPYATLRVKEGKLRLHTESAAGVAADTLSLSGAHDDIEVKVAPEILARALPYSTGFAVRDEFVYLLGDGFSHLVSTITD